MIAPGALVRVRQCGLIAWVVERQEPDGRWHVVSKATDGRGRVGLQRQDRWRRRHGAGRGCAEFRGWCHDHAQRLAYTLLPPIWAITSSLLFPLTRRPLGGGGALHIAAGQHDHDQQT